MNHHITQIQYIRTGPIELFTAETQLEYTPVEGVAVGRTARVDGDVLRSGVDTDTEVRVGGAFCVAGGTFAMPVLAVLTTLAFGAAGLRDGSEAADGRSSGGICKPAVSIIALRRLFSNSSFFT